MKTALISTLALVAASCSPSPEKSVGNPAQEAVSAYLRKTLDDPASYQPAHWGKEEPIRRVDSIHIAALPLLQSHNRQERDRGYALAESIGKDSATQIGITLVHAFRAKNKMGGVVLDSARFIVTKAGKVALL